MVIMARPHLCSEIQPDRELPGSIPGVFRGLNARDFAKRRGSRDIDGRRGEVRMVRHVSERRLEPQLYLLAEGERLRKAGRNSCRTRSLQRSHPAIPDASRPGRWIERVQIEIPIHRRIREVRIAHAIGPQQRAGVNQVEVRGVESRARDRSQVRSCLPQGDRAHFPASQQRVGGAVHIIQEFTAFSDW